MPKLSTILTKKVKKDWNSTDDECLYPMLFQKKNLRSIRPTNVSNTSLSARC
jgi:hypothetical protein